MVNNKSELRSGFTTGACATAATKAALLALIHQRRFTKSKIRLPIGQDVTFRLHTCTYTDRDGYASIIKDAGDDPDVTHQAEIRCRVTWCTTPGITFTQGEGVGLVTKRGLPVAPGEPAINPVPRQMMVATVQNILSRNGLEHRGVSIEISIPNGEQLATKTFNPRLGIVGGLSILGTTGIVVPYSTAAWEASVLQNIDVALAQACEHLIFTVGGRGERFAQKLFELPEMAFVQIGNFFGMALEHAAHTGAKRISMSSMIGKLAKFAAGNSSVHSQQSDQDFSFLADVAKAAGASHAVQQQIRSANTAQEVTDLSQAANLTDFHDLICRDAWTFAQSFIDKQTTLEVLLLGRTGDLLGRYPSA